MRYTRYDLWEANNGILILVNRETMRGYAGFQMAQNSPINLDINRTEYTFRNDVSSGEFETLVDRFNYLEIHKDIISSLYELEGQSNQAIHIAIGINDNGRISIDVIDKNVGASAKWYLGKDYK